MEKTAEQIERDAIKIVQIREGISKLKAMEDKLTDEYETTMKDSGINRIPTPHGDFVLVKEGNSRKTDYVKLIADKGITKEDVEKYSKLSTVKPYIKFETKKPGKKKV